jgi:hypothetical protein
MFVYGTHILTLCDVVSVLDCVGYWIVLAIR